jgi:hypothetical protein
MIIDFALAIMILSCMYVIGFISGWISHKFLSNILKSINNDNDTSKQRKH